MAIKRRVQEFLLKLPDEETSARLRDNLLHSLHFLQLYYRVLQNRDKNNDTLQWTIDHSLSPLTPFREAPDKFEWDWINVESQKVRQSFPKMPAENLKSLPLVIAAVKSGDLTTVRQLVAKDFKAVNATDLFTRDCLTYAVQFDRLEILKFLLENGANVNHVASDSSTCLHRAVYRGDANMVELLLSHKANVNVLDCFNRSPLHWSVVNNEIECLKILLKHHPNIHIKDKDGMSPSMWACYLDHLDHLKCLTKLDPSSTKMNISSSVETESDNEGKTWLHWSVRKNEPLQCLNFLINEKSFLLRDKEGKTCLHVAAELGAVQACRIIIKNVGVSLINELDNKKQSPLHLATLNGQARAIKLLIDLGADPNLKDITGASPIDYVTKRNLFFCNSIIEICLRNQERKNRQGAGSSNSVASNGSESNLTPAPPSQPKNPAYSRSFQYNLILTKEASHGRPPRPLNATTGSLHRNNDHQFAATASSSTNASMEEMAKTAPASLSSILADEYGNSLIQQSPPPPPPANKPPHHYRGWNSTDRIMSGSLRLSRASTRTSLASDDLEKYLPNEGSLDINNSTMPNGFVNVNDSNNNHNNNNNNTNENNNNIKIGGLNGQATLNNIFSKQQQQQHQQQQPNAQPRISSSNSANNLRINSGRAHDTSMSTASYDLNSSSQIPPPIKPRKSSSLASLNHSNLDNSLISKYNQSNENLTRINTQHQVHFNHYKTSANLINSNSNSKVNHQALDVEDLSGDELSVTSVKGEGFASDISDNEISRFRHQQQQQQHQTRLKSNSTNTNKKVAPHEPNNLKRPSTPLDHRQSSDANSLQQQQQQQQKSSLRQPNAGVKFQQIGDQPAQLSRFNEWDPYASNRAHAQLNSNNNVSGIERQKSPQKQKNATAAISGGVGVGGGGGNTALGGNANANFAFTFVNQDASPRQTSGRAQLSNSSGAAAGTNLNQVDSSSTSNLDLVVSGQKVGARKESPTNTPREIAEQPARAIGSGGQHSNNANRPFTRRLKPLENMPANDALNSSGENHFVRQKTSKATTDRKKLEPLKGGGNNSNTSHGLDTSTGHSITENDGHLNNEEDPSISENTVSSDKQLFSNIRNLPKKKKSAFNQSRKKFFEPNLDEALKM